MSAKQSQSSRAGLQFPVGRVGRYLKRSRVAKRVSPNAAVYLASVLEYISAEVLELAGNATRDNHKWRLTPRHITLAVENDEELAKMFKHATITEGGVLPSIHSVLLPYKAPKDPNAPPKKKKASTKKKGSKKS
jgi:histone H2A